MLSVEARYPESHYAECRYAEVRGAVCPRLAEFNFIFVGKARVGIRKYILNLVLRKILKL
jgi:hypothetical protein